jgi:hypothetical protein
MSTTTTDTAARHLRIAEIRNGALVRARLGQAAVYRFEGGRHVVTVGGVATSGDTLDAAIAGMLGLQRDGGHAK